VLITTPRFKLTQSSCATNGLATKPDSPHQQGIDQVCFTGTPPQNSARTPNTFWSKMRHILLAPFRWIKALWQGNEIQPGNLAPNFTLNDHAGRPVQLYDALKQGPVVLFFYPKNNSAFCTKQVKAFRDSYPDFQKLVHGQA